jgi:hypothetical protein
VSSSLMSRIPRQTIEWLSETDNPAVAVLTRRLLLGETDSSESDALWASRNEYAPVARILDLMRPDGSWAPPARDYQKYGGSLWQIHFLGELYANGDDERMGRAVEYAFSRQLQDGSWSCMNMKPTGSITCLTANVGRALARMGWAEDKRVHAALGYCVDIYKRLGIVDCREGRLYQLNGYCHMLTPKVLLFLGEIPQKLWPDGATELRDACVTALRDKEVFRCLPVESREFQDAIWSMSAAERHGFRERFLAEHEELHYREKPGWLRFGYPLSYNSDALESLAALAGVDESRQPVYEPAIELVEEAAGEQMRWTLRTSFNGKMLADVEEKGRPSKWLTWRALRVLSAFETA